MYIMYEATLNLSTLEESTVLFLETKFKIVFKILFPTYLLNVFIMFFILLHLN